MKRIFDGMIGQKGRPESIVNVLKCIALVMLGILMLPITLKSFHMVGGGATYVKQYRHAIVLLIGLGVVLLCLFIFTYFKRIMKLDERSLRFHVIGLSVVIVALQLVILIFFDVVPTTDNYITLDLASAMSEGKASELAYPGSDYFSCFGNMYFYTLLLKYIFKVGALFGFTNYIKLAVIANMLLVDLSIYLGYKIVIRLFDKRRAVLFLLLTALNPMFCLMLPWTYTAMFSMPFFMGVIYFGIVFYQTKKQWVRVASISIIAVCSILGYFLRPTVLIATIALACTGILVCIINKGMYKQLALASVIFILVTGIGYVSVNKVISSYNPDREANYPVTHWLMMGMHGAGRVNPPDMAYTTSFATKEEKKEANIAKMKEYWKEEGVKGYAVTLLRKLKIVWTDGPGGYAGRMQQDRKQSVLYDYLAGGKKDGMYLYCQIYLAFLYVFITYSVVISIWRGRRNGIFTLQLILLGAIVFYLIWEAKELYRVPFAGLLVMLALVGIDDKSKRMREISRNKFFGGMAAVLATTVILIVWKYDSFTKKPYTEMKYSIKTVGQTSYINRIDDIAKEKRVIEQDFYAKHDFNTIVLNGRTINKSKQKYEVSILDQNKKLCKKFVIDQKKVDESKMITLRTETLPGGQKYYINIKAKKSKQKDSIAFGYRNALNISQYDGELVDLKENTKYTSDLFLQVFEESETTFTSAPRLCLFIVLLLVLEVLAGMGYYNAFIRNKEGLEELECENTLEITDLP